MDASMINKIQKASEYASQPEARDFQQSDGAIPRRQQQSRRQPRQ